MARLCGHVYVQGNYSDMLVQLSAIYSNLRGDASGVKNEDSAQVGFLAPKRIFWPLRVLAPNSGFVAPERTLESPSGWMQGVCA